MARIMTTRGLLALKPGAEVSQRGARGTGTLQAVRCGAVHFYFRYTFDGRRERIHLGAFDPNGKHGGITLAEAGLQVAELRKRYAQDPDLRAAIAAEESAKQAEAETQASREQATLGALCTAYVAQLRRRGRHSARQVELALRRHIAKPRPKLWNCPAAEVTTLQLVEVLARLTHAGKLREASKLRAYLRAAYVAATNARHSASAVPELRALRLSVNPAAALTPIEGANRARERCLSLAEARAYLRRIAAMPDPTGALLRFHFLTGGQRAEQLARARLSDFDHENATLRLLDPKGRRDQPRKHVVPLLPEAVSALQAMSEPRSGPFIFTFDHGLSGCDSAGLGYRVRQVAAAMVETGEATGPFTFGDLRRTIATRLQELGVSVDVRAHLQSHGLGGLLQRHYEKHGYLTEMRDALEKLHRLVAGDKAKVIPIHGKRA